MSGLCSREPGMVGAALEDRRSFFGIIADGYHVHPASFAVAVAAKQAGGAILVTDAMPSVGSARKTFDLFGETVHADGGCCRTADGTLAGSDTGLIDAVRNAVRFAGLDRFEALRMASAYPAKAIGMDDQLGYIRPGYRASLIAVDDHYSVCRSWIDGVGEHHSEASR
jgi:N-acetylglucosamine-6-phosphate deacetylase